MRISDWSSDVCSSDLPASVGRQRPEGGLRAPQLQPADPRLLRLRLPCRLHPDPPASLHHRQGPRRRPCRLGRSEEHTSELQSLMRISYAVFCLKKKNQITSHHYPTSQQRTSHNID